MAKAKSPKTTSIRSKKNGKHNGAPTVGVETPASAEPATQAEKLAAASTQMTEQTMTEQTMTEQQMPEQKPAPKLSAVEPLPAAAKDLEAAIRQRAYQIYLERHGAPGNPQEDWARAEREVKERFDHQRSA